MKNILLLFAALVISFPSFSQVIVTAVGDTAKGGTFYGDGGPADKAGLNGPYGIALDDSGNLYICDEANRRIRKASPGYGGIITTIAGTGTPGYNGDHIPGIYAQTDGAQAIAIDHRGNVYIADEVNQRIRKISPSDTITTIAGTGSAGYNGDSIAATAAMLNHPKGIAIDNAGNIYIADAFNYRIRKIDTTGTITTIAGTGTPGYSPDGSLADTARIDKLLTIATDRHNNIYFGDNYRIRKIDTAGRLTTIAGNGTAGYSGDSGLATAAEIGATAITIDSADNLYIADGIAYRVRKVDTSGIITSIAGTGNTGYRGDGGPPLLAWFDIPSGIAVNRNGDIYISDAGDDCIRLITKHPIVVAAVSNGGQGISLYPNPSGGSFMLRVSSPTDEQAIVTLTNMEGIAVKALTLTTNRQVELSPQLPAGSYLITAATSQHVYAQQLVIE